MIFSGFGPALLGNPINLRYFREGPKPPVPLWIRACHLPGTKLNSLRYLCDVFSFYLDNSLFTEKLNPYHAETLYVLSNIFLFTCNFPVKSFINKHRQTQCRSWPHAIFRSKFIWLNIVLKPMYYRNGSGSDLELDQEILQLQNHRIKYWHNTATLWFQTVIIMT